MSVLTLNLATRPDPPADRLADEQLVRKLRAGDAAAGKALVERYGEPLMRYLHRLTGAQHVAEELHQQTWLSVLQHLDRFDEQQGRADGSAGGGFKSWLYRIATNKANDLWRGRGREAVAKAGLRLVTDDAAPDAGHRVEGDEQAEKLRRAIEQLPEPQKQVVMMRYYANLKFHEIAEIVGCPLNTALGRMHKAMQKLKAAME
jgi:RNA polymerase sigma-70 factor (ECF subfamily)